MVLGVELPLGKNKLETLEDISIWYWWTYQGTPKVLKVARRFPNIHLNL
jgi:hypothetical protein